MANASCPLFSCFSFSGVSIQCNALCTCVQCLCTLMLMPPCKCNQNSERHPQNARSTHADYVCASCSKLFWCFVMLIPRSMLIPFPARSESVFGESPDLAPVPAYVDRKVTIIDVLPIDNQFQMIGTLDDHEINIRHYVGLGVARLAERSGRAPNCKPRPPLATRSISWSRRTLAYLASRVNLGTESLAISLNTDI